MNLSDIAERVQQKMAQFDQHYIEAMHLTLDEFGIPRGVDEGNRDLYMAQISHLISTAPLS